MSTIDKITSGGVVQIPTAGKGFPVQGAQVIRREAFSVASVASRRSAILRGYAGKRRDAIRNRATAHALPSGWVCKF